MRFSFFFGGGRPLDRNRSVQMMTAVRVASTIRGSSMRLIQGQNNRIKFA